MTEKRRTTRPAQVSPTANDRYPQILEAGCSDPENGSIDAAVKLALSDDPQEYSWALRLLRDMAEFKRDEAAVFLIGLLMTCGDRTASSFLTIHVGLDVNLVLDVDRVNARRSLENS